MGNVLKVIKPGLATSVQDLGRTGYQQYGVVVAGAMDSFALQVGNLLVGNPRGEAGLEIVIMGPKLQIMENTVLAICGADLSPELDGFAVSMWKSFAVKKGQILTFGQPKNGGSAYITVAGGIKTPDVMGSKSTYTKAQIGGLNGHYLQKEDTLVSGESHLPFERISGRGMAGIPVPDYNARRTVRVVLGPDQEKFTEAAITQFLGSTYKVTSQSDRMGYRLEGPALKHINKADILSDAILPGTIQVPSNGQPIVLLADRQTTGGYTRIATVITVDLPFVAQKLTGSELQFEAIQIEEAQRLYIERELLLRKLQVGAGV